MLGPWSTAGNGKATAAENLGRMGRSGAGHPADCKP
jgi:hypothetical protein